MPSKDHQSDTVYNKLWQLSEKYPSRAIGIMLLVTTVFLDFVLLFTGWFEGGAFVSFLTLSLITSALVARWNDIEAIELWGQKLQLKKMSEEAHELLENLKNFRRQSIRVELMRIHNSSIPEDADLYFVKGEINHFSHICDLARISHNIGECHPLIIMAGRNLLAALVVRDEDGIMQDSKPDLDRVFRESTDFEAWINLFSRGQAILVSYGDDPAHDFEKFGPELATRRVSFWNSINSIIRPCILSVQSSDDKEYISPFIDDLTVK